MKKISFDDKKVIKLCNDLVAQGIEPTVRLLIEKLGGGSPNLVLKYIRQWRKECELANTIADDLSAECKRAVLAECARHLNAVRENLQKQLNDQDAQLNELQELLGNSEARIEELEQELLGVKNEADVRHLEYEGRLAAAREQIAVRTEQANELKNKLDVQAIEFQEQLKQLLEAKHQADIKIAVAEARNSDLEKQLNKIEQRAIS